MARLMLLRTLAFVLLLKRIQAATRRYWFNIEDLSITRLCETRTILSVNKQYPGPTVYVNEGDRLIINVANKAAHSISIHWHGVFQNRTCWYDGPSFVSQCPIRPGSSYTYDFTVTGQRGTLWWHAHTGWLRATVHGAFIVHPVTWYPFQSVAGEPIVILQQWWNSNVWDVEAEAVQTGGGANLSDAYAINGFPGPLYGACSASDVARISLRAGYSYLFRVVNAAIMTDMFLAVADHMLTVVEADAAYVTPFETPAIVISPGQTTNFLLTPRKTGKFYMAARPYSSSEIIPFDNSTTAAIIEVFSDSGAQHPTISRIPELPDYFDTPFVSDYHSKLRSLRGSLRPVPLIVDKKMVITVGLNVQDCPPGADAVSCQALNGGRFAASMNNRSNELPNVAMLKAYYDRRTTGVYTTDFPDQPAVYDFTGTPLANLNAVKSSSVITVEYGTRIQMVLQGTSSVVAEDHPIHLHGMDFYVVGTGLGNYNPEQDDRNFNLVDPHSRNTVRVPAGGWTAIRFKADNPGIWFMHCHLDLHTTWGLITALVVKNGLLDSQQLIPPPPDYPSC